MFIPRLGPSDALLVVAVQVDFCPGGALPVAEGDQVVPVLNRWIEAARRGGAVVVASRDWHPPNHCSFREFGGPWPRHCVRGSPGAAFHPDLRLPADAWIIDKATEPEREVYSDFGGTGSSRSAPGAAATNSINRDGVPSPVPPREGRVSSLATSAPADLAERLHRAGVRRLWVGGLALDYCVQATVLDGLAEGFQVHLLLPATRAVNVLPGDGDRAVERMRRAGAIIESVVSDEWPVVSKKKPNSLTTDHWPLTTPPALLTDLYQLTMAQAYLAEGLTGRAVFELAFRRLPPERNFLLFCGLADVLDYLEQLRFAEADLAYLAGLGQFSTEFLDWLDKFRFSGDVLAMAEGSVFFANEPVLQVAGSLPEAQFIESMLLNQIHYQTLIASKAARAVLAADGKATVVDFGLRRSPGPEAGLKLARNSYIAGAAATSNVLAGREYGIPVSGTMAHSYIQAHGDESAAFLSFARRYGPSATLLVDTYDTLAAVERIIELHRRHGPDFRFGSIRLDSGDLADLARQARRMLDRAGLRQVRIFVSGNLDEYAIADLVAAGAPIDGFGVGTKMAVSDDVPYLDCAYKLVEYAGRARMKLGGKATLPGRKQVWRFEQAGRWDHDVISLAQERLAGQPLLTPVMLNGERQLPPPDSLEPIRRFARGQIERLPDRLRTITPADPPCPVQLSERLEALERQVRRELEQAAAGGVAPVLPANSNR